MTDEAIGREIRQLREDIGSRFTEIKTGLDKLLPREVYEAKHDALVRRVDTLEKDAERAEAERVTYRRWAVSAVVLPLVSMAVMIILAVA